MCSLVRPPAMQRVAAHGRLNLVVTLGPMKAHVTHKAETGVRGMGILVRVHIRAQMAHALELITPLRNGIN